MELTLLAAMAVQLTVLCGLALVAGPHVRRGFPGRVPPGPRLDRADAPRAAVIVPLTGDDPRIKRCLDSLLAQDYPDFELIMVTADANDPAVERIKTVLDKRPGAGHVVSGPATACGQKNHNLLAGVAEAGDRCAVLVFCDGSHEARPDFLSRLILPIAQGRAALTTGFHNISPADFGPAALGATVCNMIIHLLQAFPPISQPWGGATAISRAVFEAQDVAELWSTNIVDDFSMGPRLARAGIRALAVPEACLTTRLSGQTMAGWADWWTRQLLYLKFGLPLVWAASAPVFVLAAAPLVLAPLASLAALAGLLPWAWAWTAPAYFCLFALVAGMFRRLVPERVPARRWALAFFLAPLVSLCCYAGTMFTNTMTWRGISYRVTWGGRVLEVRRPG